jgi:hypothetical protein
VPNDPLPPGHSSSGRCAGQATRRSGHHLSRTEHRHAGQRRPNHDDHRCHPDGIRAAASPICRCPMSSNPATTTRSPMGDRLACVAVDSNRLLLVVLDAAGAALALAGPAGGSRQGAVVCCGLASSGFPICSGAALQARPLPSRPQHACSAPGHQSTWRGSAPWNAASRTSCLMSYGRSWTAAALSSQVAPPSIAWPSQQDLPLRRRLTAEEAQQVGPVADVRAPRSRPSGFEAMRPLLPPGLADRLGPL